MQRTVIVIIQLGTWLVLSACSDGTPAHPRPGESVPTEPAAGPEHVVPPSTPPVAPTPAPTGPVPAPPVMPSEPGLPPPAPVCVEQQGGSLSPGTAVPSRAGVYDPSMPIVPEHLNWMVGGVGCVTYPGASTRHAVCSPGGGQAPVVGRTLCAQ